MPKSSNFDMGGQHKYDHSDHPTEKRQGGDLGSTGAGHKTDVPSRETANPKAVTDENSKPRKRNAVR
jgi:hypothetical protein